MLFLLVFPQVKRARRLRPLYAGKPPLTTGVMRPSSSQGLRPHTPASAHAALDRRAGSRPGRSASHRSLWCTATVEALHAYGCEAPTWKAWPVPERG